MHVTCMSHVSSPAFSWKDLDQPTQIIIYLSNVMSRRIIHRPLYLDAYVYIHNIVNLNQMNSSKDSFKTSQSSITVKENTEFYLKI